MGHRVCEEGTLGVSQRLDLSHSWGRLIWCRIIDEGLDNMGYGSTLCHKTFGQALSGFILGVVSEAALIRHGLGRADTGTTGTYRARATGSAQTPEFQP